MKMMMMSLKIQEEMMTTTVTKNALTCPKTVPWSSASTMPRRATMNAENIVDTATRKGADPPLAKDLSAAMRFSLESCYLE